MLVSKISNGFDFALFTGDATGDGFKVFFMFSLIRKGK